MSTLMTPLLFNRTLIAASMLCFSATAFAEEKTNSAEPNLDNVTDYRGANTPVNYSYIALNIGQNNNDHFDEKLTVAGLRGQVLLNEQFIFKMGYEATLLDQDNLGNNLSYQSNMASLGLGYRYPIFSSTDIEFDAHILYNWNSNDLSTEKDEELGYKVGAYINQGIGDTFEGTVGVNYSSEYNQNAVTAIASITKYITEYVGVGLDGRFSNNDNDLSNNQAYIGVHLRLAFY